MKKKKLLLSSILIFFFLSPGFADTTTSLRDELPDLKRLSDYTIGEKRVLKAIKYEAKRKYKKSQRLYSEALEYFLLANEQYPANSNIYFYLGFTSEKLKKSLDAEIYYILALDVDPGNNVVNKYLGILYFESNRFKESKKILKILENCKCDEYNDLKKIVK